MDLIHSVGLAMKAVATRELCGPCLLRGMMLWKRRCDPNLQFGIEACDAHLLQVEFACESAGWVICIELLQLVEHKFRILN